MLHFRRKEMTPPLIKACIDNDISKVENCFILNDLDVNGQRDHRGRTPQHIAACRGNVEIIRLLCRYGGDLSVTDDIGNTLLHLCNHVNVINFLRQQGLSPFERNRNGDTPSMLAERFGACPEVLALLYKMEQDEIQNKPPKHCPVFGRNGNTHSYTTDKYYIGWTDEVLSEFGPYKLLVILLVIACLSLYITYYIIGEMPFTPNILNKVMHMNGK